MKLDPAPSSMAPLLESSILSRPPIRRSRKPEAHDLIESDNFVFPRTGVQVAPDAPAIGKRREME